MTRTSSVIGPLLACASGVALAACGVECPEWAIDDGKRCLYRPEWPEACPSASPTDLSREGELLVGEVFLRDGWGFDSPVLQTQEEYSDLMFRASISPPNFPPVNFDTHVVIGTWVYVASSCHRGIILDHGLSDDTTLVLRLGWPDGLCEVRCDAYLSYLALYALPRPVDTAAVCVEFEMDCDDR